MIREYFFEIFYKQRSCIPFKDKGADPAPYRICSFQLPTGELAGVFDFADDFAAGDCFARCFYGGLVHVFGKV